MTGMIAMYLHQDSENLNQVPEGEIETRSQWWLNLLTLLIFHLGRLACQILCRIWIWVQWQPNLVWQLWGHSWLPFSNYHWQHHWTETKGSSQVLNTICLSFCVYWMLWRHCLIYLDSSLGTSRCSWWTAGHFVDSHVSHHLLYSSTRNMTIS
jgi:hypothetical protein